MDGTEIVGLGTQVIDCLRVRKLIDKHAERFLDRVYTPAEQAYCGGRAHSTEHFAAVWAAKEAVFRALGTTWQKGTAWTDVEVDCANAVEPRVELSGPTRERMQGRGVTGVRLALAHCRAFATATAIAWR